MTDGRETTNLVPTTVANKPGTVSREAVGAVDGRVTGQMISYDPTTLPLRAAEQYEKYITA